MDTILPFLIVAAWLITLEVRLAGLAANVEFLVKRCHCAGEKGAP